MVPGSTLRYGSHFCRVTLKPRLSRRQPIEEAATPFPSEETTPPVTKIYFGAILSSRWLARRFSLPGLLTLHRSDVQTIMVGTRGTVNAAERVPRIKDFMYAIPGARAHRNLFPQLVFRAVDEICPIPCAVVNSLSLNKYSNAKETVAGTKFIL